MIRTVLSSLAVRLVLVCAIAPALGPWVCSALGADALPTARPADVGLEADELQAIDAAMQAYVDEEKLAGVLTLIARRGKVVQVGTYGQMDREAGKPMRRDALFRIYSMTKPITTAALMTLYDEGRFELDDPVSKFLPGFANVQVYAGRENGQIKTVPLARPITIRDLMRHTAGLAYGLFPATPVDGMYVKEQVLDRGHKLDTMVEKLVKLPLAAQPGERWMYSIAVDVQGRLIEVLSGKTLDEFFNERIFQPLKMSDTFFTVPAEKLDRLTANYGRKDGKLAPIDSPATSTFAKPAVLLSGGGGLVSSADDYLRFAQMMLNRGQLEGARVLKPETVDLMTQNHLPESLVPIGLGPVKLDHMGFGLGVAVRVSVAENEPDTTLGEYGWGGAASTQFWVTPREEMVCIAMTQFMPSTRDYVVSLREKVIDALAEPAAK
ncbi:MAG: beta-lactamase family protein [Pirellulales bacterium]|nr:beta-lactamase family protein [Pirellulales bacterium]